MLSFARNGTCRRATLTCSGVFPVEAPMTRVCRLPLRQGPTRRHPQEINPAQGASLTCRLINFGEGGKKGKATRTTTSV